MQHSKQHEAYPEDTSSSIGLGAANKGWKYFQGGLGGLAAKYGKGSASQLKEQEDKNSQYIYGEDFTLPRSLETDDFDSWGTGTRIISMDEPISETNVGYRLIAKMGWREGQGLGKALQGRAEPVRLDSAIGTLGIGKSAEDDERNAEVAKQRRLLEAELRVIETEDQTKAREDKVARLEMIKAVVSEQRSVFSCKLCNKTYTLVSEWENHLSSYDHHHRARFQEMKQQQNRASFEEKQAKLQKREERDTARMMEMANRAAREAGTSAGDTGTTVTSTFAAMTSATIPSNPSGSQSSEPNSAILDGTRPALSLSFSSPATGLKRKPIGFSISSTQHKKPK